jgi:methyltransferase (TIGR00027 family)
MPPSSHEPQASRTALVTSLMRALHTKYDRPALIEDTWADQLVSADECSRFAAAVLAAMPNPQRDELAAKGAEIVLHSVWRNLSVYAGVIIRTRYTEEQVRAAVERGVRQYVVIGAGFDSFGVRGPEFARDLHVYEVDHPASQQLKCNRLSDCKAAIPSTLHFVPADLSKEDLGAALARSSFKFDEPAIMSWLGVTVYLTREANLATLRSIAGFAAPGSELVFTYVEQRALDSSSAVMLRMKASVAAVGEPWLSGFDPSTLGQELRNLGLEIIEDLSGRETRGRYCANRTDGLSPGGAGRIARVRVIGRAS